MMTFGKYIFGMLRQGVLAAILPRQKLWEAAQSLRHVSSFSSSSLIHPTACVHPDAVIGHNVHIGPYCVIDKGVNLGSGVKLHSHVVMSGNTRVGQNTTIFPFSSVGNVPQDLKYRGEDCRLEIGENCIIRENVTINIGTAGGGGITSIGHQVLMMTGVHIAHDCRIGNQVILSNNTHLAGHVTVDEQAIIGGHCGVHQNTRIGKLAMVGGMSGIVGDVIPYGLVKGNRARLHGLNLIGLRRRKHSTPQLIELLNICKYLFQKELSAEVSLADDELEPQSSQSPLSSPMTNTPPTLSTFDERLTYILQSSSNPLVQDIVQFCRDQSRINRKLCAVADTWDNTA